MTTDPAHPAPGRLELVRRFANTEDRYGGHDDLADADRAAAWLAEHDLLPHTEAVTTADLGHLHRFRAVLHELAATTGPSADALNTFNQLSAAAPQVVRIDTDEHGRLRTALAPHRPGVTAAIAELAASVHEAVLTDTWPRLKACANPDCAWLFYDTSRSRTGRWCSMRACGSIHKARAYRARNRPH
ncbi:CGNR zinc finger domain-containing protein [Pseudonocardia acaciae]|uniref:CGNR zinc finger domain-containing protein n=1 Tax=Pseudonocardia acaciae TaxID=551276 RepID=UPI0006845DC0|nr:CGNR zinc finger domain-containing protein [Pseudonocardia acaciae]